MLRDLDQSSMSELESEYELEMDNELEFEDEVGDGEYEGDYESDYETNEEAEYETSDGENSGFAERFYELSQMEFESENELDREMEAIVDNMAEHFSFRKLKRLGKRFLKSRLGKMAMGAIPGAAAIKGVTSLLKGDLKGVARAAVSSFVPGAAPALAALGFEVGEPEANREAWENYVEVAQESFENAADMLNESAADPMVAHKVAKNAFGKAMRTVTARVAAKRRSGYQPQRPLSRAGGGMSSRPEGTRRVVHLRPGEYLVVVRKRR